jgi:hypothetical protein
VTLILRAELLERTGKHAQSESLLHKTGKKKSLTSQEKGATEYILGRIAMRTHASMTQLPIFNARLRAHQRPTFQEHVGLVWSLADWSQTASAQGWLRRWWLRSALTVIKLGSPTVSAGLHVCVGEMEAKTRTSETADRHIHLAQTILGSRT